MSPRITRKFYRRNTLTVAWELLGCVLVHEIKGVGLSAIG